MKEYTKPKATLVMFGNDKLDTVSSRCDCYAERWDYEEDFTKCKLTTGDFSEVADANSGL